MSSGYLALILHAHLPFVRHPEHERFLEEEWLFEAITETYLPLIKMMQRLAGDQVPFRLSMTISPTLCAMLQDPTLIERYVQYLDRSISLAQHEIERNRDDATLRKLSEFYYANFSASRSQFLSCDANLVGEFRKLRDAGCLEIVATAATHGLLPLLQSSPEAVHTQILVGCDSYRSAFGADPAGFWLPECAYAPGLEVILKEAKIRWFIVDAHGLMFGHPRPRRAIYAPCYTAAGPAVFARERDSSRQIWSATEGYPGDPAYRDFYRDIGFDRPLDYLQAINATHPVRKFTGLKYHRITGPGATKELYDPDRAGEVADRHASHFLEGRRRQMRELRKFDFDPILVAPFDAELFGHWWFEGPRFLESLIRQAASQGDQDIQLTTPAEFMTSHPTHQRIAPAASTWGENGHLGVWLDESNSWIYPHLHSAARRMSEIARLHESETGPLANRALKQLARELLLAQSSDWAFLMKTGTAKHYATQRVTDHLNRFNQLCDELLSGAINENFLSDCEWRDNLFPDVNWRYYLS